mgnify:CR=1 FL=1
MLALIAQSCFDTIHRILNLTDSIPSMNIHHSMQMTKSTIEYKVLINNLKLLGDVEVGDKIDVKSLSIAKPSIGTSVRRTLSGESRYLTISFIMSIVADLSRLGTVEESESDRRVQIRGLLVGAKSGLANLAVTYSSDRDVLDNIQHAVEEIDRISRIC